MKKLFLLFTLNLIYSLTFSQEVEIKSKPNQHFIGLTYTFTHFYNKPSNEWHYTKNVKEIIHFPREFIGMEYTYLPKGEKYGFFASFNATGYFEKKIKTNLQFDKTLTRHRDYMLYSVGGLYSIIPNQDMRLKAFVMGGIEYRRGEDLILIQDHSRYRLDPDFTWNIGEERFKLNDIGLFTGAKVMYQLPYNFYLSGSVKFSYFLLMGYDKDQFEPYSTYLTDPPKNTLSVNIGVGYSF